MTAPLQVRTVGTGLLPFRAQVVIGADGSPRRHLFAASLKSGALQCETRRRAGTAVIRAMLAVAVELASRRWVRPASLFGCHQS